MDPNSYKYLWLCLLFSCQVILCKEISTPSTDKNINVLNECQQCKVLTDSFNYWFKKTSRGKYEGGDVAWEEAKLKTYARSEVRLVEIQEGLCSELKANKDQCYSLADVAENVLENWYYSEDHDTVNLYTWLCIQKLQNCCPLSHYGESCSPCPHNLNNEICSGNGKCHGDGTREGNGTCICKSGYSGNLCEECAEKFFSENASCRPCHAACAACTGESLDDCITCSNGWEMQENTCVDINECALPQVCENDDYCINQEGTFLCEKCDDSCKTCTGPGRKNCSTCRESDTLISGMCLNESQKNKIVNDAKKRVLTYFGLLLLTKVTFRSSKILAAVVVLFSSFYIYHTEDTAEVPSIDLYMQSSELP